jgi:hypothetical protein
LIRYNRSLISSHILPSIYLDIIEEEQEEEAGQELAVDQELSSSAGSRSTTSAVQQLS